jgi:hypothetical protein
MEEYQERKEATSNHLLLMAIMMGSLVVAIEVCKYPIVFIVLFP